MRLLSHRCMATKWANLRWQNSGGKASENTAEEPSWRLRLLDDYLKGATYSPSGTNCFAVCAPVAPHCFNDNNNSVNYRQSVAVAHTNA